MSQGVTIQRGLEEREEDCKGERNSAASSVRILGSIVSFPISGLKTRKGQKVHLELACPRRNRTHNMSCLITG